jgi:protein-S-isoprenylcysteine O-methyltransferase Ste14
MDERGITTSTAVAVVVVITVGEVFSKELIFRRFHSLVPHVHKAAAILVLTGAYLLAYWCMNFLPGGA